MAATPSSRIKNPLILDEFEQLRTFPSGNSPLIQGGVFDVVELNPPPDDGRIYSFAFTDAFLGDPVVILSCEEVDGDTGNFAISRVTNSTLDIFIDGNANGLRVHWMAFGARAPV